MALSQEGRFGRLITVLPENDLVLLRFDGHDHVDELFHYHVDALSTVPDLDIKALVGTPAQVIFGAKGGPEVPRHGIITSAEWAGVDENGNRYRLELRPWLWVAGRRNNHRIFHNQTVVEIIEKVVSDWDGVPAPHFENRLGGSYPVLEYTVQYGESDLNFLRRQMERFGISFHFKHVNAAHTMVLTDDIMSFDTLEGGVREYRPSQTEANYEKEHFFDWRKQCNLTTTAVRLMDFNFKTPTAMMEVTEQASQPDALGHVESYYYPGDYLSGAEGRSKSALRLAQEQSGGNRHVARGNTVSLASGMIVSVGGDHKPDILGDEFLCLSARHSYQSNSYGSGGSGGDEWSFSGEYDLIQSDAQYAAPRVTPAPRIPGPQTAMVVGQGEIDCDPMGRIWVRFHWDREGKNSMRCRVIQNSASGETGGMVIPRIGMEAVVEFINGDPDKPIVTGCVFNGRTDNPYGLPTHKTKHVMRADTHEGQGFNEISFESQAGRENMALHAQRDQTVRVLNNQSSNISANRSETIGANSASSVAANQMERVGANKSISVGGGGMGLLQMLLPLVQAGGKLLTKGAAKAGAGGSVMSFAGGVASVADMPRELAAISDVADSRFKREPSCRRGSGANGRWRKAGPVAEYDYASLRHNDDHRGKVPKNDGWEASTEQIGVAKNVTVGSVINTTVGKLMATKVGEDVTLDAKKSIFTRTKKHTLHAKEKVVIGGPGGSIIIDSSGVTIKALSVKVKSPSVDFSSGSPDQVETMKTDKPLAQQCK